MWGSDEERFQHIERQLDKLVSQVNHFVEAVTSVLIAAGEEDEPNTEIEANLPQNNSDRSNLFWTRVVMYAVENGFYIKGHQAPELRRVAMLFDGQINDVIKSWNEHASMRDESVEVATRIPTDWFDALYKTIEDENS